MHEMVWIGGLRRICITFREELRLLRKICRAGAFYVFGTHENLALNCDQKVNYCHVTALKVIVIGNYVVIVTLTFFLCSTYYK